MQPKISVSLQAVDCNFTASGRSRNKDLFFRATVTFDKEENIRGILTYPGQGGRVTKYHVQFWNSDTYQFEDIAVSLASFYTIISHILSEKTDCLI